MKNLLFSVVIILVISSNFVNAQVAINTTGDSPSPSAILDVSGTTGGMLIPRMTTIERDQIPLPAVSLLTYNTDIQEFQYWNGVAWSSLAVNISNEFIVPIVIDIPAIGNNNHWEITISVPGVTMNSTITVTATCTIDDSDGDIIITPRVISPGFVILKFSEVTNKANSAVYGATLNLKIENP